MSLILAIDTSCDDTSASVVTDGTNALSNIVSSQNQIHEKYGGIVPELASRRHIEIIWQVTSEALTQANTKLNDLSAIAVCKGPGLIGSLIIGCQFAKAIAYSTKLPLIAVNHLEGHIFSPFLLNKRPEFPFLGLIVSGGHTSIYRIDGFLRYTELGRTRDDAAGEAYDKVAKMLGLGYPGGPIIDRLAKLGNSGAISFPKGLWNDTLDFSFSGLKTSVRNYISNNGYENIPDICASFQKAVIDVLLEKTKQALKIQGLNRLVLSGGVAANSALCEQFKTLSEQDGIELFIPPASLCTDNAAMIGAAAHFYYENKIFASPFDLNPEAYMPIGLYQVT